MLTPALVPVIVLAKEPVPGRVKTRLTPPYTPEQAAALAAAALHDTLAAVRAARGVRPVLCLAGDDAPVLTRCGDCRTAPVVAQRGADLGERLAAAFADVAGDGPAVLVRMDTPQVRPALLTAAAAALRTADAVLGPADDGGWWLLGLRRPRSGLFDGVPMSTARTGSAQLHRLQASGLHVVPAPRLRDVDTAADAAAVAALAPRSRFARRLAQIAAAS